MSAQLFWLIDQIEPRLYSDNPDVTDLEVLRHIAKQLQAMKPEGNP
jgi:hypothetical protein